MASRKSDRCVVPMKPGNSGGGKAATPPERTGEAPAVHWDGDPVNRRLARIRRRARTHRKEPFNNLFSHLDAELLMWAFERLAARKATGVDGVSVEAYGRKPDRCIAGRAPLCESTFARRNSRGGRAGEVFS